MITRAAGSGTPRCPSTHRRMTGPSLSRKKRLNTARLIPNTSDASPLIPLATPFVSVAMAAGTADARLDRTLSAPDESTPASFSQPSIFWTAELALVAMSSDWDVIPPTTSSRITTPSAMSASRTSAAPAARGTRLRWRDVTSGEVTAAAITATTVGATIVDILARIQVAATRSARHTRSTHATGPTRCSQRGGAGDEPESA